MTWRRLTIGAVVLAIAAIAGALTAGLTAGGEHGGARGGASDLPVAKPSAGPRRWPALRQPGPRLARLHVAGFELSSTDAVRTISLVDPRGQVIGSFHEPFQRDPLYRIVELTVRGRRLQLEIDQSAGWDAPVVTLTLHDGTQIELSEQAPAPDALLPPEYTEHLELLDALQREANPGLVGADTPEIANSGSCTGTFIAADGICFGDCSDLACERASANLAGRCARSSGCCDVLDCTPSCLRAPGPGGDVVVVCQARQVARLVTEESG